MFMSGPYWIDDLHDEDFINNLLENLNKESFQYLKYNNKIKAFLENIKQELPLKSEIFNYDYSRFSSDLTLSCPKLNVLV
jgi:tRNA G26 N,N-dimethylase Trm1